MSVSAASRAVAAPRARRRSRLPWAAGAVTIAAAAAMVTLVLIVAFLVIGLTSGPVHFRRLVSSGMWDPTRRHFGGAAMIWGTGAVAAVALGLAAPVGWMTAVAINEIAPRRWRRSLRSGAELLAVVPSIVYGLIGIAYIRPLVARVAHVPGGDSLVAAGLVLAVMVLPTIVAVSIDALAGVPETSREAAAACGLTRSEVIWSAVLPPARRGLRSAALLGLARALGETVAVFLVVGRADGRLPRSVGRAISLLVHPGQTLTTKLNGPESLLAGTSGEHWAALCGLGLLLLAAVAGLTVVGQPGTGAQRAGRAGRTVRPSGLRGAVRGRASRDRTLRAALSALLVVPFLAVAAIAAVVVTKGTVAFDPHFWWSASVGANGGGIRDQLVGTVLLVVVAGLLAAPVGLGLGLLVAEYAGPRWCRWLQVLTLTLGGVPSILLGLCGYWLFVIRLGWGKSWLAGSVVLAVVAVPPVVIAVAGAAGTVPSTRREAASALGLRRDQLVRSVVVPQALPGLVTGLLLGLARAVGETAPLLFTATVFSGASALPSGIRRAPVAALPTHIFVLAQDAAGPGAIHAAWGAALALIVVAGFLVAGAVPARRWMARVAV